MPLPQGFETSSGNSRFLQIKDKEVRIRILPVEMVTGWELWINKKPVRKERNTFTLTDINNADINRFTNLPNRPTRFLAMVVYDYFDNEIKVFSTTKATIHQGIEQILLDPDWANETEYDLVISRDMTNKKYIVRSKPKTPIKEEILEKLKLLNIDLNALFTGGDPFANSKEGEISMADNEEIAKALDSQIKPDELPFG